MISGRYALAITVCLLSRGLVARADLGADFGAGYSDNLARSETNPQTDTFFSARVGGTSRAAGGTHDHALAWELGGIEHLDDEYSDEPIALLDGDVSFNLAERFVSWTLQDRLGRQALDPFAPVTLEASEFVNYFATGPQFLFPVRSNSAIEVALTYADVWYELQTLSNTRAAGRLGFEFGFGERRTFGLYAATQEVRFDEQDLHDGYDRRQLYLQYETRRSRGTLRSAIGQMEIVGLSEQNDAVMLELDWARSLSAFGQFAIEARHGLSDAGDLFVLGDVTQTDFSSIESIAGVSAPLELSSVSTAYTMDKSTHRLSVRYQVERYEYQDLQGFDRELPALLVQFSRTLTPRLRLEFIGRYGEQRFLESTRVDEETRASIGLERRLGERSTLLFQVTRFSRVSDEIGGSFDENRFFATFRFGSPLSDFQTMGL